MEQYLAKLVPVDEWPHLLYKVTYWQTDQDTSACVIKWLVSIDTHIEDEADRQWPGDFYTMVEYEEVCEVSPPRILDPNRGYREDASTAGNREARARGLL